MRHCPKCRAGFETDDAENKCQFCGGELLPGDMPHAGRALNATEVAQIVCEATAALRAEDVARLLSMFKTPFEAACATALLFLGCCQEENLHPVQFLQMLVRMHEYGARAKLAAETA